MKTGKPPVISFPTPSACNLFPFNSSLLLLRGLSFTKARPCTIFSDSFRNVQCITCASDCRSGVCRCLELGWKEAREKPCIRREHRSRDASKPPDENKGPPHPCCRTLPGSDVRASSIASRGSCFQLITPFSIPQAFEIDLTSTEDSPQSQEWVSAPFHGPEKPTLCL